MPLASWFSRRRSGPRTSGQSSSWSAGTRSPRYGDQKNFFFSVVFQSCGFLFSLSLFLQPLFPSPRCSYLCGAGTSGSIIWDLEWKLEKKSNERRRKNELEVFFLFALGFVAIVAALAILLLRSLNPDLLFFSSSIQKTTTVRRPRAHQPLEAAPPARHPVPRGLLDRRREFFFAL